MADITLVLSDTPSARVAIRSTFKPAIGKHTTPAQGLALDMLRTAKHQDAEINDAPDLLEQMLEAANQRDVLARLLARCIDPLRNLEAEGGTASDCVSQVLHEAEAALQALARQELEQTTGRRQGELVGLVA